MVTVIVAAVLLAAAPATASGAIASAAVVDVHSDLWRGQGLEEVDASVFMDGGDLIVSGIDGPVRLLSRVQARHVTCTEIPGSHAVLSVTFPEGKPASSAAIPLGDLHAKSFLAAARVKRWWMGPAFGSQARQVPIETQFMLVETTSPGMYALLFPLLAGAFRSTLAGNRRHEHQLDLRVDSGDPEVRATGMGRAMLIVAGEEPYELVHRAFAIAADEMGTFRTLRDKTESPALDYFGWCTWDACYSDVSPPLIRKGVDSLVNGGTPPRVVIVDDGWQSVDGGGGGRNQQAQHEVAVRTQLESGDDKRARSPLDAAVGATVGWIYRHVVEPAPALSKRARTWRLLTRGGPLRKGLEKFFDEETDFSKSLYSFKANAKFESESRSLKGLVGSLREEMGVRFVYCWHALGGYWSGISPHAEDMAHLRPEWRKPQPTRDLLEVEPAISWDASSFHGAGTIAPDAFSQFYARLHSYLQEAGVDGVKVDAQSGLSPFGVGFAEGASRYTMRAVHEMEQSVLKHFAASGAPECINCMCHSTENLLSYKHTSVIRASDDFYPRDRASHGAHVANVAFNSVFLGEVGVCDWDMFQSAHDTAPMHAAARAVGGCAVYVSDEPGRHNFELLRQLVLPDGTTLRAKHAGRPTVDCLTRDVSRDGRTALKIWNENSVNGVVAAFNVQGSRWSRDLRRFKRDARPPPVAVDVSPADVAAASFKGAPWQRYAVYEFRTGDVRVMGARERFGETQLEHGDWQIYLVAPTREVRVGGEAVRWAALGLLDMMNGGAAVISSAPRFGVPTVLAVGSGRFGIWAERKPRTVRVGRETVDFAFDGTTGIVSFHLAEDGHCSMHVGTGRLGGLVDDEDGCHGRPARTVRFVF